MLVGEMEYEDILERQELETFNGSLTEKNGRKIISGSLNEEYIQTYFIGTTHIMMTAFMFFMSIIVMNLLFGLAVTDVQVNNQNDTKLFGLNTWLHYFGIFLVFKFLFLATSNRNFTSTNHATARNGQPYGEHRKNDASLHSACFTSNPKMVKQKIPCRSSCKI